MSPIRPSPEDFVAERPHDPAAASGGGFAEANGWDAEFQTFSDVKDPGKIKK